MQTPQRNRGRTGRPRGRPSGPWDSEKLTFRVPPGVLSLTEQIGSTLRRWNGQSITDGMAVAEALIALAERMIQHPETSEGEKMVLRERSARVRQHLDAFYREWAVRADGVEGEPIRP